MRFQNFRKRSCKGLMTRDRLRLQTRVRLSRQAEACEAHSCFMEYDSQEALDGQHLHGIRVDVPA